MPLSRRLPSRPSHCACWISASGNGSGKPAGSRPALGRSAAPAGGPRRPLPPAARAPAPVDLTQAQAFGAAEVEGAAQEAAGGAAPGLTGAVRGRLGA